MGVDLRKPPLPAPTESSMLQTSADDVTGTDLATDVSRRTDRTSYSIPEDGSPVTISTKKREHKSKDHRTTLTRASHQSQTSLLIEYFEGGKGPNVHSRPSVRVKVTPSSAQKGKATKDHIVLTEAGGHRKPSYTRRISLGHKGTDEHRTTESDERSISSYTSAAEDSSVAVRRPPVEIEVMQLGRESELSAASLVPENRSILQTSDISSMPPDSVLDGNPSALTPQRNRSRSLSREEVRVGTDTLRAPVRRRSRSLSRERIAQKVIEKLESKSRRVEDKGYKQNTKSQSRSVSKEHRTETVQSPRRKSSRHHHADDIPSGNESSILTTSQVSEGRRSGDQHSIRSGTSQISVNNPRLVAAVDDAIRRLILPVLTTMRQEKVTEANRSQFERDRRDSIQSGSSMSRDQLLTRKLSKHASAPNVSGKPTVVLNRDEHHPGITLSGNSIKGRKDRRHERDDDSPSERSFDRGMSEETVVRDQRKASYSKNADGHGLSRAVAGAVAGGILTRAALRHHDSKSSVDRRERRRKRSKSHSRSSASLAESTDDVFLKHDVSPMPMRSEITNSDLTRDSILSERTSTPTSERRRTEIRQVARGSPKEVLSPAGITPTRSPEALTRGAGTYSSSTSREEGRRRTEHNDHSFHEGGRDISTGAAALAGTIGGVGLRAAGRAIDREDTDSKLLYSHQRGLSPIQSVASYREEGEPMTRDSLRQAHSVDSLTASEKRHRKQSALSIDSLSSAASATFVRSKRPQGINLETDEEILGQHDLGEFDDSHLDDDAGDEHIDHWYEQQHEENNRYRDSLGDSSYRNSTIDAKHTTHYTDDSIDPPYHDKVTAAQHVRDIGANPKFILASVAVESAVASLHDSSVVDFRSMQSGVSRPGERSYLDSPQQDEMEYTDSQHREIHGGDAYVGNQSREVHEEKVHATADLHDYRGALHGKSTPQEYHADHHNQSASKITHHQSHAVDSPRQSIARSIEDEHVPMTASGVPIADDPLPEIGHNLDSSQSDITTNPSIIRDPLGGLPRDNRSHWPHQPTPPRSKGDLLLGSNNTSAHESLKAVAANMLNAAAFAQGKQNGHVNEYEDESRHLEDAPLGTPTRYKDGVNHDFGPIQEPYLSMHAIPTPPNGKDEGYISAAYPPSRGATPDHGPHMNGLFGDGASSNGDVDAIANRVHLRHSSGNSHGMPSPLYDSATGRGLDRIQSKDVVALMDHLTVRDYQRNARDTEILVTLVRSAAEMRNSFEDLKRFISEADVKLMQQNKKQHELTTQRILGGPRPQPLGTPRVPRRVSADEDLMDDLPLKRRNVFKRALRGLGGRSSTDLARIEEMFVHLLNEVESLKASQDPQAVSDAPRTDDYQSRDATPEAGPDGYEPEGQAGTSSTGNQSGYFSNPPSRQTNRARGFEGRHGSHNRVSTVLEGDEEPETTFEAHKQNVLDHQFEHNERLLTPTREAPRGSSVPLDTPPTMQIPIGTQSNEHTPKTSTDKSRKHKSSSSSFFPKISRWSKTTASSAADNVKGSGRRERPLSEVSRSVSDFNYNTNNHYDPQGDDRLRSNASLEHERPPSPLIPSQVSETPAYQAHRDSLNLQHPQPRPGPTARYQNRLESQVQTVGSPISPTSETFGSNPVLARYAPNHANRLSGGAGNLSPISDAGYSNASSAAPRSNAPARPPKVCDDGPLVPQRPPKVATSNVQSPAGDRSTSAHGASGGGGYDPANNGSPRSSSHHVTPRKPTGPRPIGVSGNYSSPDKTMHQLKQTRYRGSPNHIDSSSEDVTF